MKVAAVSRRLLLIALLATALALLTTIDRPLRSAGGSDEVVSSGPEVPAAGAVGSVWYCAAGSAGAVGSDATVSHDVVVMNPTGRAVVATLTVVSGRETGSADPATSVPSEPVPTTTLRIPARSSLVVPVEVARSSVMVELNAAGPIVSHRIVIEGAFDEAVCATSPGIEAHFPIATTDTARGASTQLWLFNPFGADASVDVGVSSEEGVRTPGALRGLVVPARSSVFVDVGRIVQARDQFAMSVRTRSGVVIAEATQLEPGGAGLVLTPGVTTTATRLVFADGRSGNGVTERYVLYNPGRADAAVLVSVVPFNTDPGSLPEKFDVTVPAGRYELLDMQSQTRVPVDRPHWVRIESVNQRGIVVGRLASIVAADSPFGGRSGTGESVGQAAMSKRWWLPWADRAAASTSVLAVVNPSIDTIAKVTVERVAQGALSRVGGTIELAPGGGAQIDLGPAGDVPGGLIVRATAPVVAERRALGASGTDITVIPAVGRAGTLERPPSMSQTTSAEIAGS